MLFCDLWQDKEGNPIPEHKWPTEDYWKEEYPERIPDSSSEKVGHQLFLKKGIITPPFSYLI